MRKTNTLARTLALLFLPVLAAISLVTPAGATSSTPARWLTVAADGSISAADTGSPVAPLALRTYISNETNVKIGVSQYDNSQDYTHLLAAHRRTDDAPLNWEQAASFYVGGGYCLDVWIFWNGSWQYGTTVRGSREYLIDQSVMRWAVKNLRNC
ncbi:hypothetical protein [Saccharothrix sp. Mg75]|uniref:hypothetical protein n=1 Tax=Saccharothrix sp. Mg75 TaxID=3445357 RepID=UPI003EE86395